MVGIRAAILTLSSAAALFGSFQFAAAVETIKAPNEIALDRLVAAANSICVTPEDYGYTTTGKAQGAISANIPKLLGKLFSFGISGSVGAAGEFHKGIAQKDLGSVLQQRNSCAEHVFIHLIDHLALTDLASGEQIKRPSNPAKAFRARQVAGGAASPTAVLSATAGNGGFAGMNNGSVTINNNAANPSLDHKNQIDAIAQLVNEANQIESDFAKNNDTPDIKSKYASWLNRVDAFLTSQFDPSYSAQLEAATGDAMALNGHSIVGNSYWATLRAKNAVLIAILSELRR